MPYPNRADHSPCGKGFLVKVCEVAFRKQLLPHIVLLALVPALFAQPGAQTPGQDPLMSLMLAQPKIELGAPVMAVAWFEPSVVGPGQAAFYHVMFNALEESIDWPGQINAPDALNLKPGARGQVLQLAGATMEPRTTYNSRVRPTVPGTYVIPAFKVQVYGKSIEIPAAKLEVGTEPGTNVPQQLLLEFQRTNLYVGQPGPVRILLPTAVGGPVQVLTQVQLSGDGVIVDQGAARQKIEGMNRGGTNLVTFVHETVCTPMASGTLHVFAQAFATGTRVSGIVVSSGAPQTTGGTAQFTLVESDPVDLTVQPLPKEGELPGFTGAIGSFSVDPPKLATNTLRVGDPVKLTVTVRSAEGFARLVAPPAPKVKEWQVLASTAEGEPAQLLQAHGFATFNYTLIPMSPEAHETPAIPFSCFDPNRRVYTDLTIAPVSVSVLPGRAIADLPTMLQAETNSIAEEEQLALSGLAGLPGRAARTLAPLQQQAWFPAVQLAPIAAFCGLWGWDRRRRFLEEHPEIVLRKRARRGLRRQRRVLRRAARDQDTAQYTEAALKALQLACAPHFPADPRALVGSDILEVLNENKEGNGTDGQVAVVRRIFAATDAERFAGNAGTHEKLWQYQTDLDQVLEKLEANL